jgi:DNA processing protein
MFDDHEKIREQAALLALVSQARGEWYSVAQLVEANGSARRVAHHEWTGFEQPELIDSAAADEVSEANVDEYVELILGLEAESVSLVTVLDEEYPTNLRLIYNRPPFLFVRGELRAHDDRALAVVGTRSASNEGREQAARLARDLVDHGATVLSGLATGIDTSAHQATLEARGRTVAVMGTGIRRIYPAENRELAARIVEAGGALVSQFWPDAPPTRYTFPMRNVVMSGMGVGTVVVEASSTSGAKMQARLALDHGKRLFLVESLVLQESWAREYAERPGATVVSSVDDVLGALESETRTGVAQLALGR